MRQYNAPNTSRTAMHSVWFARVQSNAQQAVLTGAWQSEESKDVMNQGQNIWRSDKKKKRRRKERGRAMRLKLFAGVEGAERTGQAPKQVLGPLNTRRRENLGKFSVLGNGRGK